MTLRMLTIVFAALALLVFAGCPEQEVNEGGGAAGGGVPGPGEQAPEWTLVNAEGEQKSLSDYEGELVLMDFWATWCPPCRAAMPGLQRLHEEYSERGLHVLGMNAMENGDPKAFMKENGYTYELLLEADEVAEAYGVRGIPTFVLVGGDGTVLFSAVGYSPEREEELERVIAEHLAG